MDYLQIKYRGVRVAGGQFGGGLVRFICLAGSTPAGTPLPPFVLSVQISLMDCNLGDFCKINKTYSYYLLLLSIFVWSQAYSAVIHERIF